MVPRQSKTGKFGRTACGQVARSIRSSRPSLSKDQLPEPRSQMASGNNELAPLIVPQEVTEALSNWLTKGVSTGKSKAISKRIRQDFVDKEFSEKPPKLDGYMYRRLKDKGKL